MDPDLELPKTVSMPYVKGDVIDFLISIYHSGKMFRAALVLINTHQYSQEDQVASALPTDDFGE